MSQPGQSLRWGRAPWAGVSAEGLAVPGFPAPSSWASSEPLDLTVPHGPAGEWGAPASREVEQGDELGSCCHQEGLLG